MAGMALLSPQMGLRLSHKTVYKMVNIQSSVR